MDKNIKGRKKLSVIIPTVGRVTNLKNCLVGLFHQTVLPDEIVIIDNGPTMWDIKKLTNQKHNGNIELSYSREPRRGVGFARNAGLKVAKHDLVAFIDDDCIADKDWVKEIHRFNRKNPSKMIKGKNINGLKNNMCSSLEHYATEALFQSQLVCLLDTKNCAFRKSIFTKPLYFDTRFSCVNEDMDFGVQARMQGIDIVYNPNMLVKHYGRVNLIKHFVRAFNIGRDGWRLDNKWKKEYLIRLDSTGILKTIKDKNKKGVEKKLLKKTLKNKSRLFRFIFHYLFKLDKHIERLGFVWENRINKYK